MDHLDKLICSECAEETVRGRTIDEALKELRKRLEAEGYEVSKMTPYQSCVFVTRRKKGEEMWEFVIHERIRKSLGG